MLGAMLVVMILAPSLYVFFQYLGWGKVSEETAAEEKLSLVDENPPEAHGEIRCVSRGRFVLLRA